jgi:hypothetical protein
VTFSSVSRPGGAQARRENGLSLPPWAHRYRYWNG